MGMLTERIVLTCINCFLPPLSVMLVAGVGMDALLNTMWLLCGVIPGHIHGFYVTWTYFSRKRKVKKGRYPGGSKSFIYSTRVTNGDASDERVRQLWRAEQRAKEEKLMRRRSSWRSGFGNGGRSKSAVSAPLERQGSRRTAPAPIGGQRSRGSREP